MNWKRGMWVTGAVLLCTSVVWADNTRKSPGSATTALTSSQQEEANFDPAELKDLQLRALEEFESTGGIERDPAVPLDMQFSGRPELGGTVMQPLGGELRQGGDTCATATVIPSLPYSDSGTTVGATHDYNEVCPFANTGAPDVVYSFTPASNMLVEVSLCGNSDYDTKVYVYQNVCPGLNSGAHIACADDVCATPSFPDPYVSRVTNVLMTVGNTYYIVVDGYDAASSGNYTIDVTGGPVVPVYCASNATSSADSICAGVHLETIVNDTPGVCAQYSDFTAISTDLTRGATYPVEVVTGTCGGCFGKWSKVFVDWNQDGDLTDAGEEAFSSGPSSGCPNTRTGNITVPVGAALGPTRMRVVVREGGTQASTQPCGTYTWGETEDYTVNILEAPPEGACCDGVTCTEGQTENECSLAGGSYQGDGSDCSPNPCIGACCNTASGACEGNLSEEDCAAIADTQWTSTADCVNGPFTCPPAAAGNDCSDPVNVTLPAALAPTYVNNNTTCGRGNSYEDPTDSATCMGFYTAGEDLFYSLNVTDRVCVNLNLDTDASWTGISVDYTCPPDATCIAVATSSAADKSINNVVLDPGSYSVMIDTWPSPDCIPNLTLTISECATGACCVAGACSEEYSADCAALGGIYVGDGVPCEVDTCTQGGCCFLDGSCEVLNGTECADSNGVYQGDGTSCTPNTCPGPGDACGNPIILNLPADLDVNTADTTCGRGNDYTETCMGSYDGGEDIVYEINVASQVCVNVVLDADTIWGGIAVDDTCPLGGAGSCLAQATTSADPDVITGLVLAPGTYYMMADTWPAPDCMNFSLGITECPTGACCGDGVCLITSGPECLLLGGVYGGDNTACAVGDCNNNGADDFCEIVEFPEADCNDTLLPDDCDIAGGTSGDCDFNGIPDECEADCNNNGVADGCDIVGGTSLDCQPDGIPDECQLGGGGRAVLYSQAGIADDVGVGPSGLLAVGSSCPFENSSADDFTLADSAQLTRIEWQGVYFGAASNFPGVDNNFHITVYLDNGAGNLGAVVADFPSVTVSKALAPRPPIFGTNPVYDYGADLPAAVSINGGQRYWLSINGDPSGAAGPVFGWLASPEGNAADTPALDNPLQSITVSCAALPAATMTPGGADGDTDSDLAFTLVGGPAGGDCNSNGIPDDCDITAGTADDCDTNGVPDDCEFLDCDENGVHDPCDILQGADDCNADNIPDKCQTEDNDCDGNGVPDDCDLVTDPDCNNNGILDECDITSVNSLDCQQDGIPDECQLGVVAGGNVVQDSSFEDGTPNSFWTESSTNFGTPLCDTVSCGTGGGTAGPRTGAWWAWFGGIAAFEVGAVEQSVTIPPGSASLEFWLWNGASSNNGTDNMRALIDGNVVFSTLTGNPAYTGGYTLVQVDVSAYADGGSHLLRLDSTCIGGGTTNFSVDDVELIVEGSAGNDCNNNSVPDECDNCADLDGDGDADATDYQLFRDTFGRVDSDPAYNGCADYDDSGAVGLADFQTWLGCYRDYIGNPLAGPPVNATPSTTLVKPVRPGTIKETEFGQESPGNP